MKFSFRKSLLAVGLALFLAQSAAAISLEEAARMVAQQNNAKVLSARTVHRGNQRVHEIRILTRNGVVKTVRVPAPPRPRKR